MDKLTRPDTYARNTLERYTGSPMSNFGSYIILVNFQRYVEQFAQITNTEIHTGYWTSAHDRENDISIINFGVGSPSAGIVTHCLSYLDNIQGVLMLGMCGGIDDELEIGDLLIPTASVRDEGTSKHYLPKNVPAQPNFWFNRICEEVIRGEFDVIPKSGIMLTTDYRMWEFDENFINYILHHRILAIDMEIATLFSVAYAMNVPIGAIMLISDMPLRKGGIKTKDSAHEVFQSYSDRHLRVGLRVIDEIKNRNTRGKPFKLKNEW
ncbi:MAG TPA: AMP nucleosidase [Spirochaetota bacterium]|nr:AMP nucleosidase [Spirochaetota bacterium]